MYISKDLFEDALNLIIAIQSENVELIQVNEDKAYLLFILKKYDQSIKECLKILKINEQNVNVLNTLGLCYFSLKKYDNSNKVLLQALHHDEDNIKILNSLDLRKVLFLT